LKKIKSFQLERYDIVFTSDILAIGCQQYPIEKWKDFIFQAIELSKVNDEHN